MKKAQTGLAIGTNMALFGKIVPFIKTAAEGIKSELNELKEAVMNLKNNLAKMKIDSKTCSDKEVKESNSCYTLIFGPITYTPEQRAEWEEKMKARADKNNTTFNPEDYPKTNMIDPNATTGAK